MHRTITPTQRFRRYGVISLLNAFSVGLFVPVMSLMLLDKGLDLSTLAFTLGAYSLVVLIAEVPSGFASDKFGRKHCFNLAKTFSIIGMCLLVGNASLLRMVLALFSLALSRACISGSFEALCVDQYLEAYGKDRMSRISMMLSLWDTIGLSVGALASGAVVLLSRYLPQGYGRYDANLLASVTVNILVLALSLGWIQENLNPGATHRESFSIAATFRTIRENRKLLPLFISAGATGFMLCTVETYWQPRFLQVTENPTLIALIGVLAFLGFFGAMGGNLISGRVLDRRPSQVMGWYIGSRLLLAATIGFLAFMGGIVTYSLAYAAVYVALGMANIAENVMMNRETASQVRASILSISSFSLQSGALVASGVGGLLLRSVQGSIQLVWIIAAAVVMISVIPFMRGTKKKELL
jgi:MFS family permease